MATVTVCDECNERLPSYSDSLIQVYRPHHIPTQSDPSSTKEFCSWTCVVQFASKRARADLNANRY